MLFDPGAHRRGEDRPEPLHRRNRHARAGNAERQPRIVAGEIEAAVQRDAEVRVAELARLEIDALLAGIDAQPQQDAVEDDGVGIGRRGGQTTVPPETCRPQLLGAAARRVELGVAG